MEYKSNNIIRKIQTKPDYPELFTDNDITTINDMNEVVDRFNSFFVNVAKEIINSGNVLRRIVWREIQTQSYWEL